MSKMTSTVRDDSQSYQVQQNSSHTAVHPAPYYVYYDGPQSIDLNCSLPTGVMWSPQYSIMTGTPYPTACSQPPPVQQHASSAAGETHTSAESEDSLDESGHLESLAASVQQLTLTPHRTLSEPISSFAYLPTPPYLYPPSPSFVSPHSSESHSPPLNSFLSAAAINSTCSDTDSQDELNDQNIYVRGLSPLTTDDTFAKLCSKFGKLTSCKAILDLRTNECKGFGFAMFETRVEANKALLEFQKLGYQASFAKASATPSAGQESFNAQLKNLQDSESTNIYLSNLPLSMDEEQLLALIGSPENIVSHKILRDKMTLSSRGVGFVKVEPRSFAEKVIQRLHGKKIPGSIHPLQVRFADSLAQKKLKSDVARRKRMEHVKYMPNMEYQGYLIPNGIMTPYVYYIPDLSAYSE